MDNFKRINSKSHVQFLGKLCDEMEILENFMHYEDINGGTILQIVELSAVYVIELLPLDVDATTPAEPIDYQKNEYLEEILNFDPFGGKYTHQPLRAIFEAGDKQWLDKALSQMKNEFIRSRLDYIIRHGGYGKLRG